MNFQSGWQFEPPKLLRTLGEISNVKEGKSVENLRHPCFTRSLLSLSCQAWASPVMDGDEGRCGDEKTTRGAHSAKACSSATSCLPSAKVSWCCQNKHGKKDNITLGSLRKGCFNLFFQHVSTINDVYHHNGFFNCFFSSKRSNVLSIQLCGFRASFGSGCLVDRPWRPLSTHTHIVGMIIDSNIMYMYIL